jgi:predicted DNA-binding transcriptional regulator AlpA
MRGEKENLNMEIQRSFSRVARVRERLQVSNTTFWELVKTKKLPRQFKIAPNCAGLFDDEVDKYLDECAKASRGEPEQQAA